MKAKRIYGLALFLVSLVLITAFSSAVYAKYIKKTDFKGNTVTIQADLAKDFKIVESEAIRDALGEYSLVSDTEVSGNEYILMPGVDIPKNPKVVIEDKTALPAYLYVEIVDTNTDNAITYTLSDWWIKLDIKGVNGGTLYVYNAVLDGSTPDVSIGILKGNTVFVSETLNHAGKAFSIKFHAYLLQTPDSTSDETTIFKNAFGLS